MSKLGKQKLGGGAKLEYNTVPVPNFRWLPLAPMLMQPPLGLLSGLYGIFHGLRQSLLRGLTSVCILTDNQAAYHTLLYGRISGRNSARLQILRRINRLIFQYKCNLQIMWIPTSDNLADAFSRLSTSYSYPNQSINILPSIYTCRTIKRYWWHSLA